MEALKMHLWLASLGIIRSSWNFWDTTLQQSPAILTINLDYWDVFYTNVTFICKEAKCYVFKKTVRKVNSLKTVWWLNVEYVILLHKRFVIYTGRNILCQHLDYLILNQKNQPNAYFFCSTKCCILDIQTFRKKCQLSDTKHGLGHKWYLPDVMCLLITSYTINPQLMSIMTIEF